MDKHTCPKPAKGSFAATPQPEPKRGGRSCTILCVEDLLTQWGADGINVVFDLCERDRMGFERYGQNLETGDGRDTLADLYQEILDAIQYGRKLKEEGCERIDGMKVSVILKSLMQIAVTIRREFDQRSNE